MIQKFELTDAEVKLAVAEFVKRRFPSPVTSTPVQVEINLRRVSKGIGMSEHEVDVVEVIAIRELPSPESGSGG